jgi:uncharacterized membrane-anchored protein
MKKYRVPIILFNFILLLAFFNMSVAEKEKTLAKGHLVLLALAPVDPRSLMQGDYMELNYAIARPETGSGSNRHGYCVVSIDSNNVAHKIRLQRDAAPRHAGEMLIKYKVNDQFWRMRIGAESYFFEEGKAAKFAKAKYGGLRIDAAGNSILVGLYDEHFNQLGK